MSAWDNWEAVSIRPSKAPGSPRGPRISDALGFRIQVNEHAFIPAGKRFASGLDWFIGKLVN